MRFRHPPLRMSRARAITHTAINTHQGWPPGPRCGPGGGQAAMPPMHPWRGWGRLRRVRRPGLDARRGPRYAGTSSASSAPPRPRRALAGETSSRSGHRSTRMRWYGSMSVPPCPRHGGTTPPSWPPARMGQTGATRRDMSRSASSLAPDLTRRAVGARPRRAPGETHGRIQGGRAKAPRAARGRARRAQIGAQGQRKIAATSCDCKVVVDSGAGILVPSLVVQIHPG